jgi:hypothetical protein
MLFGEGTEKSGRGARAPLKKMRSSGHTSTAPPENQRDYEQHKEYKKQQFRDAR